MNLGRWGRRTDHPIRRQRACPAGILIITNWKGSQVKVGKKDLEELKKKVALGNRIMFYQGLADYHGHVSARIPGTRRFFYQAGARAARRNRSQTCYPGGY